MSSPEVHPLEALAYYAGLSAHERERVDAHLAGCETCRALLRDYERQDAALAAIPQLRPRDRHWRPGARQATTPWIGRVGNALAAAGLSAIIWMFALYAQRMAETAGVEGGTPAAAVPEPGLTLPPAVVRPPSPWLPALPWIGLALLLVGLLFILSRRNRWPAIAGAALAGLLLVSYVPPVSSIPNPAGLYWRLAGGYSYDPKLPFKNVFVVAGAPDKTLTPQLDRLIGLVGLAPLDPAQPLHEYEILRVSLHPDHPEVALVLTRFTYADGTSRVYPVPLASPGYTLGGFWRTGWQIDGLERLRSQHLALPGQPFADASSPIQLGPARRLDAISAAAQRLDEANPHHWLWGSVRLQRLVWAPDGRHFLARIETDKGWELWSIALDGSAPRLITSGDLHNYGWSPDGQYVVYTRLDRAAAAVNPARPFALVAAPAEQTRSGSEQQLVTGLLSDALPGLTPDGAWFFADGAAWVVAYEGGPPALALSGLQVHVPRGAPRIAPDGSTGAFICGSALCLIPDLPAQLGSTRPTVVRTRVPLAAEIAWAPTSERLAVVTRDPNNLRPVGLAIVDVKGDTQLEVVIAPRDVTEVPEWLPDGQVVLVQTYPQDGRRIIAVDVPSGQVLDLSQEHWDAYFALSPDGSRLLLNNGRGDFWTADVIRPEDGRDD